MKSETLKIREASSYKHMPIAQLALLKGDMSLTVEPCKVLRSHTLDLYLNICWFGVSVAKLNWFLVDVIFVHVHITYLSPFVGLSAW